MIARAASVAAAIAYTANCALGVGVLTRRIDTSNSRWVHHAMYIATASLTAIATVTALATGHRRQAAAQSGALVPLALIPYVGTHTRRHPVVASAAAPFYVAALAASGR